MNYQEFIKEIEESIRESLPSYLKVQTQRVMKNNGNEKVGITIIKESAPLSPTIYLEEYYEDYLASEPLEFIVERILNLYEEVKIEYTWDIACITDYNRVKDHIVYKLIHTKRNQGLLRTVPSKKFLDLSLVCYVLLEMQEGRNATVLITNHMLNLWGVNEAEVFDRAKENTRRLLPEQFCNMQCVVQCLGKEVEDIAEGELYVLSNVKGNDGAATILYDGVLEMIGDYLNCNYYVIPSSIHEVLIFPENISPSRGRLDEIIDEVNTLHLAPEEILSDNAYYYDRVTQALSL